MAKSNKAEQELIIGLGILKDDKVQVAFSHLTEDFPGWLADVARGTPAHHRWFSKCWDQVILVVLVHRNLKFVFTARECVGRGVARSTLVQLRDEFAPSIAGAPPNAVLVSKIEKKLKTIASSKRGVVPPRKVLILYEGAPKKFLTKEEQAPELLEQGKSRLQRELEDFDKDEEEFVFSLDKSKQSEGSSTEEEDEEDAFVFTIPTKTQEPQQQPQAQAQAPVAPQKMVPQSAIFPTPHMRNNFPRPPPKKAPTPGIPTDSTWNGPRVSPDDKKAKAKLPAVAIHTGFHQKAFRGAKNIFSAQFEKNGGGRQQLTHGKVMGQVEQIAPSGLRWEDEIASQLAAAGVKVSAGAEGEGEEAEKSPTLPAKGRLLAAEWRSASMNKPPERGLGFSRISRGFRRAFHRQAEDG